MGKQKSARKEPEVSRIIAWIVQSQDEILKQLEESVPVYDFIQKEFAKGDVLRNPIFMFVFTAYYRLDRAGLSPEMKTRIFELLDVGEGDIRTIVEDLSHYKTAKGQNTVQFSFATKIVHTIRPDRPIFDSHLGRLLGLRVQGKNLKEKIDSCKNVYNSLQRAVEAIRDHHEIKDIIGKFRSRFQVAPAEISDEKITDFLLWSVGKIRAER